MKPVALFLFVYLVASMAVEDATAGAQSEPRNLRFTIAVLAPDTLGGTLRWAPPQDRGQPEPFTGYEVQVLANGQLVFQTNTPSSPPNTDVRFYFECGDTLSIVPRVRATNPEAAWNPGPWATGSAVLRFRPCPVIPPGAPDSVELELDTVPTVEALAPAIIRGDGSFEWASTFDLDVDETVTQCWYGVGGHSSPDSVFLFGKWPDQCPDPPGSTAPLPVYPDSTVDVRCYATGDDDSLVPWTRADDFDLDCGGVVRWAGM